MTPRDEFDSPWKEIIIQYFEQFVGFFFPEAVHDIDWSKGYSSLDKELRQITREAEIGPRFVDNLLKVWTKAGEETWVLVHVEIQAQKHEHFAHRTYVYNYRIHDVYNRPVASFAVLADENPTWRPSEYVQELWGCRIQFHLPVVKILDYLTQQEVLGQSQNPFALVVLAHLKTLETKKDSDSRRYWKVRLTKELYRRGLAKDDIVKLYRFIDWLMVLPDNLERIFHREITEFEEEQKMQYITTAERIGMEKGWQKGQEDGWQKGREEGLKKGTVVGEILLAQRFLKLTIYSQEELELKSLGELQVIFQSMDAELQKREHDNR